MLGEPVSILEFLKSAGLLGLCVLLAWILKWTLLRIFTGYDSRLEDRDKNIAALKEELKLARAEAAAANAAKDAEKDRYHRLVSRLEPLIRDQVQWQAHLARSFRGGRGGEPLPPLPGRGHPGLEEDTGEGS